MTEYSIKLEITRLRDKYEIRKMQLEHILGDIPCTQEEQEYNDVLKFIEELEEILKDE